MAKAKVEANWTTFDGPQGLGDDAVAAWGLMKDAYRQYTAAKAAFEAEARKVVPVPAGQRLVFGYNFGKLSMAVVADDTAKAKAVGTLADFIAAQSASGRAV